MARKLTLEETYFRRVESLALSALPVTELIAAAPSHHDGVMVALVPDDPTSLAVDGDGALPEDELHITLCYLGKVQDISDEDRISILANASRVCSEVGAPFSTNTDGVVIMGKNQDGVPATALLVQSDEIVRLYDAMSEALNFQSKFPSFIPHMTAGYGVDADAVQEKVGQSVDFNHVLVKFGDERHLIPLASPVTAARGESSAGRIDRVVDALGRLWDEALHPRDGEGRFINKNGAISGKLAVPKPGGGVNVVDSNRASVLGFKTIDNDVWVLAEITNPDGSTTQGFARATDVKAVAPVKARLDLPDAQVDEFHDRMNSLQDIAQPADAVTALKGGADPFTVVTPDLLSAMDESRRFETHTPEGALGVSPISWRIDPADQTGYDVGLAGMHTSTNDRAYFVKESVLGAELGNTDITREVLASLIYDQIVEANGDDRALPIPKSVFGDNPEWDGDSVETLIGDPVHQPGHVVSQHAGYLAPQGWDATDATSEEVSFKNDLRNVAPDMQADQIAAFKEDMGDLYGNDVAKMVLWDFAVLNGDRNPGNALLFSSPDKTEGKVIPIDHGFAFDEDPFDTDDEELYTSDTQSTFEWFMQYHLTKGWLEYVRGGLDVNDHVTEATLQQVVADFNDVYSKIDGGAISSKFQEIPGVTQEQIDQVDAWIGSVVDRIAWMGENSEDVLATLIGQGPAV